MSRIQNEQGLFSDRYIRLLQEHPEGLEAVINAYHNDTGIFPHWTDCVGLLEHVAGRCKSEQSYKSKESNS